MKEKSYLLKILINISSCLYHLNVIGLSSSCRHFSFDNVIQWNGRNSLWHKPHKFVIWDRSKKTNFLDTLHSGTINVSTICLQIFQCPECIRNGTIRPLPRVNLHMLPRVSAAFTLKLKHNVPIKETSMIELENFFTVSIFTTFGF